MYSDLPIIFLKDRFPLEVWLCGHLSPSHINPKYFLSLCAEFCLQLADADDVNAASQTVFCKTVQDESVQ